MNKFLFLFFLLTGPLLLAQDEVPQNPAVASLMQYQNYPVDHYTGTPQINIPIYNLPTRSKDININVSLSYHPNSVSDFNKVSGNCGRGWTLHAGGSISVPFTSNGHGFYNFNFMGYSGKFMMTSGGSVGEVVENNQKKIRVKVIQQTDIIRQTESIEHIDIYNEEGYKFRFTQQDTYYKRVYRVKLDAAGDTIYLPDSTNPEYETVNIKKPSAFHLNSIHDNNDQVLVRFWYVNGGYADDFGGIGPNYYYPLSYIDIEGYGQMLFTHDHTAFPDKLDTHRCSIIRVRNRNGEGIRQFKFEYDNLADNINRLNSVSISDFLETDVQSYQLFYKSSVFDSGVSGFDAWGYPNKTDEWCHDSDVQEMAGPSATLGVLQKMILPTGGAVIYDFEPNTFSYNVNKPLDGTFNSVTQSWNINPNFFTILSEPRNKHNFIRDAIGGTLNRSYGSSAGSTDTFPFSLPSGAKYITFRPQQYTGHLMQNPELNPGQETSLHYPIFELYSGTSTSGNPINTYSYTPDHYGNSFNECKGTPVSLTNNATYTMVLKAPNLTNGNTATGSYTITSYRAAPDVKKWWYGGGIRIAKIGYFTDGSVDQTYYTFGQTSGFTPAKEISFNYNFFDEPNRSSGSIKVPEIHSPVNWSEQYNTIAYANVTVSESGNGRTEYTYYTQIDHPNEELENDDRVGKVKQIRIYDEAGVLKKEIINDYNYAGMQYNGIMVVGSWGWINLKSQIEKSYYPGGIVQTKDSYTYYNNYKLESHSHITTTGDTIRVKYDYNTQNSPYSQNRSEREVVTKYRNEELLSTSKINYFNTWTDSQSNTVNVSYLPQTIQNSKADGTLETKMRFNLYDQYSHVLEAQAENGIKTSYVWGYNNSHIIAKIEGAAYTDIPPALITAAQLASDCETIGDCPPESDLLAALENLRNAPELSEAMITTYTHRPLKGVSTITDPRGNRLSYHYDINNRLEYVKDKDGNILSDNKYNTQPQN